MKKYKITKDQFERLLAESYDVKGGVNRVNKQFVKTFAGANIKNLEEKSNFNIKTGMKKSAEAPQPKSMNEDVFSPEFHEAIRNFIENIWNNPSQKGLDKTFIENGITWADIVQFLVFSGVLVGVGGGVYKVVNVFKRLFSKDKEKAKIEKQQEIDKIASKVEKDPNAPWNKIKQPEETPYERKLKMQRNTDSGYEMPPRYFNPKGRKPMEEAPVMEQTFKPVGMNKEIAILNGPDDVYIFYYDDIKREDLPNSQEELEPKDLADYVNNNYDSINKGVGLKDFEQGADLVKLDEELKEELRNLYSKDKNFIELLNRLEETSTGSAGAFTGPFMGAGGANKNISPDYTPSKIINDEEEFLNNKLEETSTVGSGDATSSPTGSYVQPSIWANGPKNWKASKKTQYPNGEMVDFDPCTKLNNNKSAQKGKCSQGAADNVVKTHKTKQSVISKTIYEQIAEKTGKSVEDVKKIIETNLLKNKSL